MRCATHPNIETNLRCGKCDKPICPKCMVMTPVGARCRECAGIKRLPTYQVPPVYLLRASGAGIGSAVGIGFAWYLAMYLLPFAGFFAIILAGAAGYGVGALIGLAVNRKKGPTLALIGAAAFLLSYLVQLFLLGYGLSDIRLIFADFSAVYRILALAAGIIMAVSQLR